MRRGTRMALLLGTGLLAALGALWLGLRGPAPAIELVHAPAVFTRRAGALSANLTGVLAGRVHHADYRLDGGVWRPIGRDLPRAAAPSFVVELPGVDLRPGRNRVELRAFGRRGTVAEIAHVFDYDPRPLSLPLYVDWRRELEAQDGEWERIERDGQAVVRPRPGREGYDRLLLASGSLAGGRRIEGWLVLRTASVDRRWGCGVLSLWGGHPDHPGVSPRRGWRFALSWYYSHYAGVGVEFSEKLGSGEARWVHAYRRYELQPGRRQWFEIECWPETDAIGQHRRWRQRARWWPEGAADKGGWIETSDVEGSPLPAGEYAVGLLAHRCQVEFGPLTIEALPARTLPAAAVGR